MGVGVTAVLKEIFLPALCVACDRGLTGEDRGLCGDCRSRLLPISDPCCPRCGTPSDTETDPCLGCVISPPPQDGTVVWGEYDGILRTAVLALKHRGHDEIARGLGRRLAARIALTPWVDEITIVTAVPSHHLRRWRRGCSAAELVGAEVAKAIDRPLATSLRRHGIRRQTGRTRVQRTQLPRGSFSARPLARSQRVLLIDDVSTTGTTLRRAAETLFDAGAVAVYCAAMAMTPDSRRNS